MYVRIYLYSVVTVCVEIHQKGMELFLYVYLIMFRSLSVTTLCRVDTVLSSSHSYLSQLIDCDQNVTSQKGKLSAKYTKKTYSY